jgi:catalase
MTRMRRLLIGAAIVIAFVAISWWRVESSRSISVMTEFVPPDEDLYIAQLVASSVESVNGARDPNDARDPGPPPFRRDVHAKAHGCVRADVTVDPKIPYALRSGVFATPGKAYRAWIRFSSGNTDIQQDNKWDARGMAMKLTGVEGATLLPGPDAGTQDFIMINSPVFFIRNVAEYAKFARLLADGNRFGYFFNGYSPNPYTWHLRDMILALKTLKRAPSSLLHEQYYSLTAYQLGSSLAIKFSARPCTTQAVARVDRSSDNFLREEMREELRAGTGCFDLMVQRQVQGRYMPIEDPTVEWRESESPFEVVARVNVPKQQFDTADQNAFCESLSFSPWHGMPDHRPLGGLNRVRRAVYLEDARYRRSKAANEGITDYQPLVEPRGWCLDLSGKACDR